jgi:hypothetical protein
VHPFYSHLLAKKKKKKMEKRERKTTLNTISYQTPYNDLYDYTPLSYKKEISYKLCYLCTQMEVAEQDRCF